MKRDQLIFAIFSLLTIIAYAAHAQGVSDPKKARFITTDIANFWKMYDELPKATSKDDTLQTVNELYIDKASPVLQQYFEVERRENSKNIEEEYLDILRQYPKYLTSIRSNTESISRYQDSLYKYFIRAKELYPDFKFQDTYFCIGFFNSGGKSMAQGGLYIGTEMFALSDDTAMDEWNGNAWAEFFAPINQIHNIVLHEQAHIQQLPPSNNDYNLLYSAINEGAAVFLVDIVTNGKGVTNGGAVSKTALHYGNSNEKVVWNRFQEDMVGYDQSEWFYNAETKEWPKDMGYYVGYKICQSYYDHANDKVLAVKEILEVPDIKEFLRKSKYEGSFE